MSALVSIEHFNEWLATGNRGISSEMIATHLTGVPILPNRWSKRYDNHPHDPSDFRRCEILLRAVPEAREHLNAVGEISPIWRSLVEHWDELVALCEEDVPGIFEHWPHGEMATKTYRRMKELITEARANA